MLFDVQDLTSDACSDSIRHAIQSCDPGASVAVQVADRQVRVEGLLTEQQALDVLAAAGFPATSASPHSGAGSDCCGGCS